MKRFFLSLLVVLFLASGCTKKQEQTNQIPTNNVSNVESQQNTPPPSAPLKEPSPLTAEQQATIEKLLKYIATNTKIAFSKPTPTTFTTIGDDSQTIAAYEIQATGVVYHYPEPSGFREISMPFFDKQGLRDYLNHQADGPLGSYWEVTNGKMVCAIDESAGNLEPEPIEGPVPKILDWDISVLCGMLE
jgi:hypothetical protein